LGAISHVVVAAAAAQTDSNTLLKGVGWVICTAIPWVSDSILTAVFVEADWDHANKEIRLMRATTERNFLAGTIFASFLKACRQKAEWARW